MLRFIKTFVIKIGIVYLFSMTPFVTIGIEDNLAATIAVICVCSLFADWIESAASFCTNLSILVISIVINLILVTVVPFVLLMMTGGIQNTHPLTIVIMTAVLWLVGYIPKSDKAEES